MEELLIEHNVYGLVIGRFCFLIIGVFHPLVIKAEYYWGVKSWWCFLTLGIVCIFLSIGSDSKLLSALWGVVAFSALWSIIEVFEQKRRVEKGWFPLNPRRKQKNEIEKRKNTT